MVRASLGGKEALRKEEKRKASNGEAWPLQ
jgi:hypothetical protein